MQYGLEHHHFHLMHLSHLSAINAVQTLRTVAEGLAAVFVPIYLYKLGYSLSAILSFFSLTSLFWLLSLYPALYLIGRFGTRKILGLSLLTNILQFCLLISLPSYHWPLIIIAFASGVTISFYWLSFRIIFARALNHREIGKKVGVATALLIFAAGLAPAAGGLIASWVGVSIVYFTAIVLFLAALFPLVYSASKHFPIPKLSLTDFKVSANSVANGLINVDDAAQVVIWPLFIFLLIPSYASVGILSSVTLLTTVIISIYTGYRSKRKMKQYLRVGSRLTSMGNFSRLLATNGVHILGINFIAGFGKALAITPYMSVYYLNIEKNGIGFLLGMQLAAATSYLIYFSVLWILSLLFSTQTTLLFGLLIAAPLVMGITKIHLK